MIPITLLVNQAADYWWPVMIHATWQSSLLGCLLIAVALLGRRWSSPLRYGLVLLALIKFAVPPLLTAPAGLFPWLDGSMSLALPEATVPQPLSPVDSVPAAAVSTAAAADLLAVATPSLGWPGLLMLVHGLGMILCLLWIGWQLIGLGRMIADAEPAPDGPLRQTFTRLCRDLGLARPPRLLLSERAQAPVACGLIRPTVIIPQQLPGDIPETEMRVILAHELAHHRRGDLWLNWLQIGLMVIWWFNPVYHWLSRALRSLREDCCDDLLLAARVTTDRGYCDALLRAAGVLAVSARPSPALGFADRLHPLARRLTRIMDSTLRRSSRLSRVSVLLMLVLAGLILPGRSATSAAGGDPELAQLHAESQALAQQLAALAGQRFHQAWPAYVLQQVEQSVSSEIWLEKIVAEGSATVLEGQSQSEQALASFISALAARPLLEPVLQSLNRGSDGYRFKVLLKPLLTEAAAAAVPVATIAEDAQSLRETVAQQQKQRSSGLARMTEQSMIAQVVVPIRSLLSEDGLELTGFTPMQIIDRGLWAEWPIAVSVNGSGQSFEQALSRLALLPHALSIEDVSVQTGDRDSLTATLTIKLLLPGSPAGEVPKPPVEAAEAELESGWQTMLRSLSE